MNPNSPPSHPPAATLHGSTWVVIPAAWFTQFLSHAHSKYVPDRDAWLEIVYAQLIKYTFQGIHPGRFVLLTEEAHLQGHRYALSLHRSLDWTAFEALALEIAADAGAHRDALWRQKAQDTILELVIRQQSETIRGAALSLWKRHWEQVRQSGGS